MSEGIYHRLGTKPVINGLGVYTDLGGSRLSPTVWAAMEEANRSFARMPELLETSGRIVAGLLASEAAVSPPELPPRSPCRSLPA
jgi:seryl-tRNA(Sec) selenium transferase